MATESEYRAALTEISPLFDLGDDGLSEEQLARVEVLGAAIEAYEKINYPIDPPSPEALAQFEREMRGELIPVPV
jgi:antitoxin component HigA of HigAB toxin-antitoxin module